MLDQLVQHVGKGLTLKQSPQGTFIIGGGWPGYFDRQQARKSPSLDSLIGNAWVLTRTVPGTAGAQLVRSWGGMGTGSRDGLPIIGESSKVPGFYVNYAPLGFTMGPICGQVFAEHFLTGESAAPIAPYSLERF
jgi:glycine/D-amino acid oxidase-like deaminating enzyme